jgi:hypothetical protein
MTAKRRALPKAGKLASSRPPKLGGPWGKPDGASFVATPYPAELFARFDTTNCGTGGQKNTLLQSPELPWQSRYWGR